MKKSLAEKNKDILVRALRKKNKRIQELENELADCTCEMGPELECDHDDYDDLQKQVEDLEAKVEKLEDELQEVKEERDDFEEQLVAEQEHKSNEWEDIAEKAAEIADIASRKQQ